MDVKGVKERRVQVEPEFSTEGKGVLFKFVKNAVVKNVAAAAEVDARLLFLLVLPKSNNSRRRRRRRIFPVVLPLARFFLLVPPPPAVGSFALLPVSTSAAPRDSMLI